MSIFSMVLRLCISHTHSIEAFIIWDVLRRLVVVPGIDVRLGCQVDVMGMSWAFLQPAIARAPAHFNAINRAMAHGSDGRRPQHAARPSPWYPGKRPH